MCYSAQVLQQAKRMARDLGLLLDYDEFEKLFNQRLDDPSLVISRGLEANFEEPANDAERRIKAAIDAHRQRLAKKLETDLFAQKTRLVKAERLLKEKETKKARDDVRIATAKIDTLSAKLGDLRRTELKPRDNRIFPMVYAGVILRDGGRNLLTPMRYHCRPAGKAAFLDKQFPGLYNARRDSLGKFWSGQFGHTHALMVVESFYENVKLHASEHRALAPGEAERNVVLHFTPQPAQTMLVACLYSHWRGPNAPDVRGFAAITDEPPPEVAAAGHDRCIIAIRPENFEAWLTPEGRSLDELQKILSDRAIPVYQPAALKAA